MPVTVSEKYRGRSLSNESAEILYVVRGTSDDIAARDAVEAAAPLTHDGVPLDDIQVEQETSEIWFATVSYATPQDGGPATIGESSYSFETGGGTQHVTQSLGTIGSYPVDAPNFKGAISVSGTGINATVEGVDIVVPVYSFSETHILDDAAVTVGYRGTLFALTGTVNIASFKGTAAGECLFLGASGAKRGTGDWEITYRFAASPNKTGLVVGDIVGITKNGWEYLWVFYEDVEDATAKMIVKRPLGAYVEKVYESGDFSLLGIGT